MGKQRLWLQIATLSDVCISRAFIAFATFTTACLLFQHDMLQLGQVRVVDRPMGQE